jgi:hypothetical protein
MNTNTGNQRYAAIRALQEQENEGISTTGLLPLIVIPEDEPVQPPGSMWFKKQAG